MRWRTKVSIGIIVAAVLVFFIRLSMTRILPGAFIRQNQGAWLMFYRFRNA